MGSARKITAEYIASRLDELPTLPAIVHELSQVINDPMSSTGEVEAIMSNDQSLTSRVLKLVNSAYYAIPGGVSSLSRAIAYLGFDTVNQLVLSASIFSALEQNGPHRFDLNEFWKHSLGVAIAAETIAKHVGHVSPADLFTCGLVHDMGKIALYTLDADSMLSIVHTAKQDGLSYSEAEERLRLPTHTRIGAMLAKRWSLSPLIPSVIQHHHTTDHAQRKGLTAEDNRNIDIVILANLLIHGLRFGNSGYDKVPGAPRDLMERLTLNPDRDLKSLIQNIKMNLKKVSGFLRILEGSNG